MPWFKVDDSFHSHPKVLATDPAALGLWVVAGSWSSANLTEGFVPDHVLPRLLPDPDQLARALVTAGLWKRVRGGYRFHDWLERNPSKEAVEAQRKQAAERQKRWRDNRRRRASNAVTSAVSHSVSNGTPTRPVDGSVKDRPDPSTVRGTRGRASPTGSPAPAAKPKPAWCGQCDERTRLSGEPPHRCPACHPLAPDRQESPN